MRLTDEQVLIIKTIVLSDFSSTARVILFGSRLDDSKRGGDIDLLVEADLSPEEMFMKIICSQLITF